MSRTQEKADKSALAAHARRLIRAGRFVPLATQDGSIPFVSLAQTACLPDATPLLLISRLAAHTRHIEAAPEVSLLYAAPEAADGAGMNRPRVSMQGRAEQLDGAEAAAAKARFTALHPECTDYDTQLDFSYYAVRPSRGRIVEGFGSIANLAGLDLLYGGSNAAELTARERDVTAHMNEDHADAIALYATVLLGQKDGPWQMAGIDAEGCDLICDRENGRQHVRLDFPDPVSDATGARQALVALVKEARTHA